MSNKRILIGTAIFFIITVLGFIEVNSINTKALSSIGNGEDNYELVREEFGADFEEFIRDNADIKIYTTTDEDKDITIKIKNREYILTMNNKITQGFYNMGGFIYNGLESIINSTIGKIKKDTKEKNQNQELDNIINGFLEENNN